MDVIQKEVKRILDIYESKYNKTIKVGDNEIITQLILKGIGPGVILSIMDDQIKYNKNWTLLKIKYLSYNNAYDLYRKIESRSIKPLIEKDLDKTPNVNLKQIIKSQLDEIKTHLEKDPDEVSLIEKEHELKKLLRQINNEN